MSRLKKLREQTKDQEAGWQAQLDSYVAIVDIRTDPTFQHRAKVDPRVIDEYAEILKAGGELGAIKLIRDGKDLWLWDGHQTLEAARQAGVEKLKAEIQPGSKRDAWKKSLGANYNHGVRRNRDDLAKAIYAAITDREIRYSLLAEDGEYTYTSVAKLVRVSRKSITTYWKRYVAEEVNQEIDEALAEYSDMIAPQTEIAALIAKELHIPTWIIEQRQIEVAFNLSQSESLPDDDDESEPPTAPEPVVQAPPPPAPAPAPAIQVPPVPDDDLNDDDDDYISTPEAPKAAVHQAVPVVPAATAPAAQPVTTDNDLDVSAQEPRIPTTKQTPVELPPPPPALSARDDDLDLQKEEPKEKKNILHSSESNEWYTPRQYVEAVQHVLGSIDLDPASCELANEVVQADMFFTASDDGLNQKWWGNVFVNPPYGKRDGKSNQALWSQAVIEKYQAAEIKQAILLVNAVPGNHWFGPLWDATICFPNHRIRFYNQDGEAPQPTHSNAFVYFGSDSRKFYEVFKKFGAVVERYKI